jgi:hypothetical protein
VGGLRRLFARLVLDGSAGAQLLSCPAVFFHRRRSEIMNQRCQNVLPKPPFPARDLLVYICSIHGLPFRQARSFTSWLPQQLTKRSCSAQHERTPVPQPLARLHLPSHEPKENSKHERSRSSNLQRLLRNPSNSAQTLILALLVVLRPRRLAPPNSLPSKHLRQNALHKVFNNPYYSAIPKGSPVRRTSGYIQHVIVAISLREMNASRAA